MGSGWSRSSGASTRVKKGSKQNNRNAAVVWLGAGAEHDQLPLDFVQGPWTFSRRTAAAEALPRLHLWTISCRSLRWRMAEVMRSRRSPPRPPPRTTHRWRRCSAPCSGSATRTARTWRASARGSGWAKKALTTAAAATTAAMAAAMAAAMPVRATAQLQRLGLGPAPQAWTAGPGGCDARAGAPASVAGARRGGGQLMATVAAVLLLVLLRPRCSTCPAHSPSASQRSWARKRCAR